MLKGKCSWFGGAADDGMSLQEGTSLYEHHEADQRPDLFFPRSESQVIGTAKRINPKALYFAYRFPLDPRPLRSDLQKTQFLFRNPANNRYCAAWLIDWGPNEKTGRSWDVSPGVMSALACNTDDVIEGIDVLELKL